MNRFQYSVTSPVAWIDLPGPRYGSTPRNLADKDITHLTDGGQRWAYRRFEQEVWTMQFRVTETQMELFRTLHQTVGVVPFYVKLDSHVLYCTKESGFDPHMISTPRQIPVWEYTLTLTEYLLTEDF